MCRKLKVIRARGAQVQVPEIQYRSHSRQIGQLNCIVIESALPPKAIAVFAHGFGAPGDDLAGLAGDYLEALQAQEPVQLIFPAALLSLADEGFGDGRAWWKLSVQRLLAALEQGQYELVKEESPPGIDAARDALTEVIEQSLAKAGLAHDKLLLGGFSQGAMLAVEVACLGLQAPPAAMALYSGCLIRYRQWKEKVARLKDTRILQSHGSMDPILPLRTGMWLYDMLIEGGCQVDFKQFPGPHTISGEAIEGTAALLDDLIS